MTDETRSAEIVAVRPRVEILYFDGCPNHEPALALVNRVSGELGLETEIQLVEVPDQEAAQRLRFLGSPTVRVGGVDVDPGTDERRDYGLSCRIFRTDAGMAGQPDERWVRQALLREASGGSDDVRAQAETVQRAVEAAGIPPERQRRQRVRRLAPAERAFYRWILRSFADAEPPAADEIAREAQRLGLEPTAALDALAREDLVHADDRGAIVVAYPFSARPRGHQVLIDGARRVEAMCAIDALGIGPMLGLPIEIDSRDPVSGTDIWVRVDPGDGARWEPRQAVVLTGSASCGGPSFHGCCDVLNFFVSTQNAERYLAEHADVTGFPIAIPDAIAVGRTVFGDVLNDD